jgi:polyribonucleotide nucleotidyltransferase
VLDSVSSATALTTTYSELEGKLRWELMCALREKFEGIKHVTVEFACEDALKECIRESVTRSRKRSDGRGLHALRNVTAAVDVLPQVHGSAFFSRGDTAVLCTATLGSRSLRKVNSYAYGHSLFV